MSPSHLAHRGVSCWVDCPTAGGRTADWPSERQTITKLDSDANHLICVADLPLGQIVNARLHGIVGQSMR